MNVFNNLIDTLAQAAYNNTQHQKVGGLSKSGRKEVIQVNTGHSDPEEQQADTVSSEEVTWLNEEPGID